MCELTVYLDGNVIAKNVIKLVFENNILKIFDINGNVYTIEDVIVKEIDILNERVLVTAKR